MGNLEQGSSDSLLQEVELGSADLICQASSVLSQIEAERLGPAKAACHIVHLRHENRRLRGLLPETEVSEVPIKLMFEKINEMAEDMYISGVINNDEDRRLQAIFDEIAARHGLTSCPACDGHRETCPACKVCCGTGVIEKTT